MKFHPKMSIGLKGIIDDGVSVQDFSTVTALSEYDSKTILNSLTEYGFCTFENSFYYFNAGAKLGIALELLKTGSLSDEISESLGWRDFEGFAAEILRSKDFAVIKNMILTKPRMEIDVIGIRLGIAMLIDCKHWKRYSVSSFGAVVKKQIQRTKQYVAKTPGAVGVPVIVTLYHDGLYFIDGVPIVPISQFPSFIDDFYGNLDQMRTIKKDSL